MKVGDQFNASFCITQKIYSGFIDLFKDNNPLHTDRNFSISKGFEQSVMHGNILCGFISYFIGECLPVKNVIIHKQSINFHKPVYLNDHLNFEAEIVDIFHSVNSIEFKFRFIKEIDQLLVAKGTIQIGTI